MDLIILATGYYYDFTIFDKNIRHDLVGNPNGLGQNVSNLWGHIFWERDPTLSFILIPLGVVPFPLAELQASLIVKQIIGQLDISKIDDSKFKDSVKLEPGKDVEYSKFLQRVLDTTQTDKERDPFQPVRWDVRLTDLRMQCPKLKEQRNIQLHKLTLSFRQQGESYRI